MSEPFTLKRCVVEWMLFLFPLLGVAAIADAVGFFKMRRTS